MTEALTDAELYQMHQQAMDLAEQAFIMRARKGDQAEIDRLNTEAYKLEFTVAEAVPKSFTQRVLYTSAGHLAADAGLIFEMDDCFAKAGNYDRNPYAKAASQ